MTTHLTARLTWHDTAWNGRLCANPDTNAACMEHEHVRALRRLDVEAPHAGCGLVDLKRVTGYLPPCQRDANAFGEDAYVICHQDPLDGRNLPSVEEDVPAFSVCPTPYRWMLESNFRDICEAENLLIPAPKNPSATWVQEDTRQRQLLERFWGKLEKNRSLVFFYCNRGNAVDDEANRLLVGVSRIAEVANPTYFGQSSAFPGRFPVWSRRVTHHYPREGVRIPYQEYLHRDLDVDGIVCRPPRDLSLPFSYVAEHLSDGQAVSALLAIMTTVERLEADRKAGRGVDGDWAGALAWLDGALDEVWSGRGAYPGIGAMLRALGCSQGIGYHATVLRQLERNGRDPWQHVKDLFEGRRQPEADYAHSLAEAILCWRKMPSRHKLIDLLVRFELTTDQIADILNEDTRKQRGILATNDAILENPYRLFEQDCGTKRSAPVSLEVIDQGMLPEGDAARFRTDPPLPPHDHRRVRATMVAVLQRAASAGDSLLPFPTLVQRAAGFFPESRRCAADAETIWSSEDRTFHEQILWFRDVPAPESWKRADANAAADGADDELAELREDLGAAKPTEGERPILRLAALKSVRRWELEIAQVIKKQVGALADLPAEGPDWRALLTVPEEEGGFGEPQTGREHAAIDEKIMALEVLYRNRLSVLTGGAGTGKTSVLRIFLRTLRALEGPRSTLLAAPTGKARVKLQTSTGRPAATIHQVLSDAGMLGPNYRILETPEKGKLSYNTVVIDESSMPSVELLAALFRAINTGAIARLIFVGDPCQLPPIGPGRPFIDMLRWLRQAHPGCVADLGTCMRTDGAGGMAVGLQLANGYRDESPPGDDMVISRVARSSTHGDLTLMTWNDHGSLLAKLDEAFAMLNITPGDAKSFDRSLGISEEEWKRSEAWQIISPTRIHPFGTGEINRVVQERYRGRELANANNANRWPRAMGDQGIVFHDKVMQRVNEPKWLPEGTEGMRFVANGEIGIVTAAWKKKPGEEKGQDKLHVNFSTQPKASYRYLKSEVEESLELAYALTVHKAQGSDFGGVIFVLPRKAQTLSRELLYTALTRYRGTLIVLAEKDTEVLERLRNPALSETARRSTCMFDLLLGDAGADVPLPPRYRPEGLVHRAEDGTPMRSKSEIIVYETLKGLGLQPLYEQRLCAPTDPDDFCLPDFTIIHGGRTWYWEHLGMLANQGYRDDWEAKEAWYARHGFRDRLLTSRDHPGGSFGAVYADEIRETARTRILGH
ncbi:UvrD-like helicase family protein [Azospirillum brasilense]|uniref:UvrD-like helicase family protein n=1 Tax=Azospirillum brasilense TaxID=192 RepID=A0A560CJT0_AZOBR|nr:ATP-dependent RecD-like DNA helicase [Azospirillum brasilense]TWA85145.1 UvrD-like helicase family protein [Azospirillum brasilense]